MIHPYFSEILDRYGIFYEKQECKFYVWHNSEKKQIVSMGYVRDILVHVKLKNKRETEDIRIYDFILECETKKSRRNKNIKHILNCIK